MPCEGGLSPVMFVNSFGSLLSKLYLPRIQGCSREPASVGCSDKNKSFPFNLFKLPIIKLSTDYFKGVVTSLVITTRRSEEL